MSCNCYALNSSATIRNNFKQSYVITCNLKGFKNETDIYNSGFNAVFYNKY